MKITIKLMLFLVLLISLASLVYSAQPTLVTQIDTTGITIIYPKNEFFPLNSNSKLHFHIYNTSDFLLTNTTTSCNFHLYNYSGNHVIEKYLEFDSNGMEFYFDLNTTFTSKPGIYPYLVYCNRSINEAGFLSSSLIISNGICDKQTKEVNTYTPQKNIFTNSIGILLLLLSLFLIFTAIVDIALKSDNG